MKIRIITIIMNKNKKELKQINNNKNKYEKKK